MSYVRYSRTSDWYIFARVSPVNNQMVLAVWHKDFRSHEPEFSVNEVQRMLASNDFSAVPGYDSEVRTLLRAAFEEFVADEI